MWLHNEVALPLMRQPGCLGRAYLHIEQANDLHMRLHGQASGFCFFNMACCLALGAAQGVTPDDAAGLPPIPRAGSPPSELAEARLDLSLSLLARAVEAGFLDTGRMLLDPDLQAVRERRHAKFTEVVRSALPSEAAAAATAASLEPPSSRASTAAPPGTGASQRSPVTISSVSSPRTLSPGETPCASPSASTLPPTEPSSPKGRLGSGVMA